MPKRSCARRARTPRPAANAARSLASTTSSSRGVRPSSASRTAPPTTQASGVARHGVEDPRAARKRPERRLGLGEGAHGAGHGSTVRGAHAFPPPQAPVAGVARDRARRARPHRSAAPALVLRSSEPGDVVNDGRPVRGARRERARRGGRADRGDAGRRRFNWPIYGFDKARTHYLPARRRTCARRSPSAGSSRARSCSSSRPRWAAAACSCSRTTARSTRWTARPGKVRWKRKLGYLAASQPAYADGIVYVVLLERGKGVERRAGRGDPREGRHDEVVAQAAEPRRVLAARCTRARSSSAARTARSTGCAPPTASCAGATRPPGAVKGGLALDGDKLFFGDYGGKVHAIRAATGRKVWETGTSGGRFGLGRGQLLLDRRGRLRTRLHRQHRRLRLLVLDP